MQWIVARTQPKREAWAAENVAKQGYEYYLPRVARAPSRKERKRTGELSSEPLFPRYLFVRTAGQWRWLTGTFGISSVVVIGTSPAVINDAVIARLRSIEDPDGLVCLPERVKLRPGQAVDLTGGILAGQKGIYQGDAPHDRVKVLLDYLGRKTTVLVPSGDVEGS